MPTSTGINRADGTALSDLAHVRQSFHVIMTTHIGERVMRRSFGSAVPGVLGRNLAPHTLTVFFAALWIAIDLYEPRLRITRVLYPAPPNTPTTMRLGHLTMAILADYRPYALDGDTTTGVRQIYL